MDSTLSLQRNLAPRSWIIFFGILLVTSTYLWPSRKVTPAPRQVVRRDLLTDDFTNASNVVSNVTLLPRDDFQCGVNKPCSNSACCGPSGFCGYGDAYCGSGCVSNCEAHAECGQYAKTPGQTCPLNTCCSQHGFCGTTEEFCNEKCQSNCILSPSPPSEERRGSILEKRVIGYYESWSAQSDCHKVPPSALPLDALTHVNFAFASIEPGSYRIVTMDAATPSSLFEDTTNLKSIKPELKVYIAVGGWTFSDNGTATQPLFGEIAADASKRKTFANNVVQFMKQYGFDGIDIDWEYPGAPDRGGKPEDTQNFILLLQSLRETFDSSGSKYGITFTAPASYWYLRWFDLPGLLKYADWINLMTYDFHGVWDADNPIGSIVQGHTNLTEIKRATELLWRVNIPPSRIALGFGFYGRSFTLADPACTKPGCAFKGASNPGPCSNAGGVLMYYEIKALLQKVATKKRGAPQVIHDETAAIKYLVFNEDQWVSYDDDQTFKQKVEWANSIGFGGGLIWASDTDDDQHSAHAGLLGREVRSNTVLQSVDKALSNPKAVIEDLAGSNGQNCFAYTGGCVKLDDKDAMAKACGSGFTPIGWDDAGCGKKSCHCGKPICCPTNQAPMGCKWRGDNTGDGAKSDCSAQCAAGEINIQGIKSSWGGGFTNDGNTNKCGRGYKAFCCPSPDFKQVTSGCGYTACGGSCPIGRVSLFSKVDDCMFSSKQYCCTSVPQLADCNWTGGSGRMECANAVCKPTELQIDKGQFGDSHIGGCSWGREKVACCTVKKAPPKPATCISDVCKIDPGLCLDQDGADEGNPNTPSRRDLSDDIQKVSPVIGRTPRKQSNEKIYYTGFDDGGPGLSIIAAAYPLISEIYGLPTADNVIRRFFRFITGYCRGPSINVGDVGSGPEPSNLQGLESEHIIDRQIMRKFPKATVTGELRSGKPGNLPLIDRKFWLQQWHVVNSALAARPAVGGPMGARPDTPNDRAMEAFGSADYPDPLLPTDGQLNGAKGRIMGIRAPTQGSRVTELANAAVRNDDDESLDMLLQSIRVGFAVFEYFNTPEAIDRFNRVRQQVRLQFSYIQDDLGIPNLVDWWDLYTEDYFRHVETEAQTWANRVIELAAAPYEDALRRGIHLQTYARAIGTLEEWLHAIETMTLPPATSMQLPQPPGGNDGAPGGNNGGLK